MNFLIYIIITIAGLAGLAISGYTRHKRSLREGLTCPTGSDCQVVIYSKYSKFLGAPVEDFGIFYYLIVALSYTAVLFFPHFDVDVFSFAILSLTVLAFIFSVYLTFIQIVVLKEWCFWCLASLVLSLVIFVSVWSISDLNIVEFINTLLSSI